MADETSDTVREMLDTITGDERRVAFLLRTLDVLRQEWIECAGDYCAERVST